MLINQNFTLDRTKYLGGSDIGAVLGLSKYRSPLEVWMEKTGKESLKRDSLPLRFGNFAEEFVASEYARAKGVVLLKDESILIHPRYSYMSAHIDRFVMDAHLDASNANSQLPTKILECKTANPFAQSEWGEAGSDQVPMSYLCQCIWYMAITKIKQCDLAVLFGNADFRIYAIVHDPELEELIINKAAHFWNTYVLKDIPPPPQSEGEYHALFKKSDPQQSVEASVELVTASVYLHQLTQEIEAREQTISEIKQAIMRQMQVAEILTYQGQVLATWKSPKPSFRLDAKRLEADHPNLVPAYQVPIQNSRRLVIKHLENNL